MKQCSGDEVDNLTSLSLKNGVLMSGGMVELLYALHTNHRIEAQSLACVASRKHKQININAFLRVWFLNSHYQA